MLDVAAVGADHEVKLTWLAVEDEVSVVELEKFGGDVKGDLAALTGLEGDALKTLELLHGARDATDHVADVELDDLGASLAARVGDSDGGCDVVVSIQGGAAQRVVAERERTIAERGVAQAVAKGEQRVVGHIQIVGGELGEPLGVGTARVQVVVVDRNLPHIAWHGYGEFAAGRNIAKDIFLKSVAVGYSHAIGFAGKSRGICV